MEDKRLITKEQGEETAKQYGMKFFETSAKTGMGIKDAFETIAAQIIEKIEGSFYNVMGLPLKELYEAIINF